MTQLNAYLNFPGNTEEAFNFYKSIFGGELNLIRFRDVQDLPGMGKVNDSDLDKVMHVALKIGDNLLMATDMLESHGHNLKIGNAITLSIHPDNKAEADRLYSSLSAGGNALQPMSDMDWGYWGMLIDRFDVPWMVNVEDRRMKSPA
jgi:PhnB protein